MPEESCRREQLHGRGGKCASCRLQISSSLNPQVLFILINHVNICKSLGAQNNSKPLKMSPNPILWLSVTRLNLCLCLEYTSGGSACHLRKVCKGQRKQGRCLNLFFSSGFSALRLVFICYWFKSIPRGPASPVSSPALGEKRSDFCWK